MLDFLKSFFSNEKSPEELELLKQPKQRDVIVLDAYAMDDEEEEQSGGCCGPSGCGSCGCG